MPQEVEENKEEDEDDDDEGEGDSSEIMHSEAFQKQLINGGTGLE